MCALVTGVQTCALPILQASGQHADELLGGKLRIVDAETPVLSLPAQVVGQGRQHATRADGVNLRDKLRKARRFRDDQAKQRQRRRAQHEGEDIRSEKDTYELPLLITRPDYVISS